MSYLPDIYQHFERAFPNVHAAHQELAKACYGAVLWILAVPVSSSSGWRSARRQRAPYVRTLAVRGREHDPDEVRHVGLLALTTIGFPHTGAGLEWIDEVIASDG